MKRAFFLLLILFSACHKNSPTEPTPVPSLTGTWSSTITGTDYSSTPLVTVTQQDQNVMMRFLFSPEEYDLYGKLDPSTFKLSLSGVSKDFNLNFDGNTTFLYDRIDGMLTVSLKTAPSHAYYNVMATKR